MCVQQTNSVADKYNFSDLSKLPDITVAKLTADNYYIFTKAFCYVVGRPICINIIPIYYAMRGVTVKYDPPWTNREDKLKNCVLHTVDSFKNDNITLYSLYSQYVVTEGVGFNIINKYQSTNNGRKCHQ